jgi:cytochrome P450
MTTQSPSLRAASRDFEPVDITAAAFKADPFPTLRRWRDQRPVVPVRVLGQRAWIVTRYDDVAAALKDERLVKNRHNARDPNKANQGPWMPAFLKPLEQNMLDQDAPNHTRLRSLVHQAFMPRLIGQMQSRVERLAHQLLDRASAKGSMDVVHDFALPIPMTIISEMLGIPERDRAAFHRWSSVAVTVNTPLSGLLALPSLYQFVAYLRGFLRARRLAAPQDDLTGALLAAEAEGSQLSEDELIGMVTLLLIAGHETTVGLIGSGVLALLAHPAQLERLKAEPALMKPAIEELTRFSSPVFLATERYARADLEIAGTPIPKGELVLAALGSANHDERQFVEPERLQLDRANNKHLGFGLGMHYCVGAPLARLEASIAFRVLFERLPKLRLALPASALRWNTGLATRNTKAIPVLF